MVLVRMQLLVWLSGGEQWLIWLRFRWKMAG